ncbi:MAG: HlyD family efflux transporter periplasmic adaptor subunit [Pirellulaceae bacterium]|nr:HlyD family efflux transporter periplasmic adaptor subunit [Pirellulaceae bacterium]
MSQLLTSKQLEFPALELAQSSHWIRWVGRVTMVALGLAFLGLFFLPWQQTAAGTGIVLAKDPQERPQAFKSPVQGIVKWVKPDLLEGSVVEQGETLIELEPTAAGGVQQLNLQIEAAKLKIAAADERIRFAQEQVALQKTSGELLAESLDKERVAAVTKWEQAKRELASLEAELVDKHNKRMIAEKVFESGIISQEELVTKRQDEQVQQQKVEKAEKAVDEAEANYQAQQKALEAKLRDIEIKNREAQNKVLVEQDKLQSALQELGNLEVKRQEQVRLKITAPRSGHIQQWFGLEGSDTIKEGDQLFVIVPRASEMAVELLINGNDFPLVHQGDRVRLQFEGWPAVQFVGWPSVAIGTFGGRVNRLAPTDDGKGMFRILVLPDNHLAHDNNWPDQAYLRQGMRANGWVLLRQVSLGYELWRQINGFPPSLPSPDSKANKPKIKPKV